MTVTGASAGPTGGRSSVGVAQTGGAGPATLKRWGPLATLAWAHLLNDGASNYLPGVLPAILTSLGAPVRMAGGLMAVLIAGQMLQPIAGWVADRLGGRVMVAVGLALTSVGGGCIAVVHSTWALLVVLALIGAGGAFFHPPALASVRSMLAGRHGLITSVFLVGGEIGRGLWPTLAGFIVARFGLDALWVLAVPGVLTLPLLGRMTPRLQPTPRSKVKIDWWAHRRPLASLVGYRSIQALVVYALSTYIPIRWHLQGGSLVQGASIITTMITVGIVGNLAGGHLVDRIGRGPVLHLAAVATAVFVVPLAFLDGIWLWVFAALVGIALFLSITASILVGQDLFEENPSMGSGIALGFTNGVGAVLLFVVGLWVNDADVTAIFLALAALSLASMLLVFTLPPRLLDPR